MSYEPGSTFTPSLRQDWTCRECATTNPPDALACWLCHAGLPKDSTVGPEEAPVHVARGFFSTIAGWMVLIAIIAVCLGLYVVAPGLLFLFGISVFPALVFVEVKASRRRRRGQPMSTAERVVFVVVLTFVMPVILAASAAAALFVYCSVTGPSSFH